LSAHKKTGARVVPPLLAMEGNKFLNWAKNLLPDFIWMCAHISEDPLKGMYAIRNTLDAIDDVLSEQGVTVHSYGCLTQFEEFPVTVRSHVLDVLEAQGIYHRAFPEGFAHALGMYPGAPGSWLIEPWLRDGLIIDPAEAEKYLANIVTTSHHGQNLVPTRVKYMFLRGMAKDGHLHIAPGLKLGDYLVRYPNDITEEERRHAEPAFRAAFLAMVENVGADTQEEVRLDWCRRFWRSNWSLYECTKPTEPSVSEGSRPDRVQVAAVLDAFRETAAALRSRFEDVALHIDPDLYAPDRYEVLTGVASRVVRLVDGAVNAPLLWSTEYGAGLLRSMIEAKILLRWLAYKDDDALYTRFKNYGRGKLKLLKLHTEEYLDSLEEVPEHLDEYLERLNREVNEDLWEEFQEINIGATFSGVSARQMAVDVGLVNDYNFVFAPASGDAHGDWTALDRYALDRCLNPLHLWHRIPDFDSRALVDPSGMEMAFAMADEVVDEYIAAIRREPLSPSEDSMI